MSSATMASCLILGEKVVELPLIAQFESSVSQESNKETKIEKPAEEIGRSNIAHVLKSTIKRLLPFAGSNDGNGVDLQECITEDLQHIINQNGNKPREGSRYVTVFGLPAAVDLPQCSPDAESVIERTLPSNACLDTSAYESALDETILCTPGIDPSLESTYYDATTCTAPNSLGSEISAEFAHSREVSPNLDADLERTAGQRQKEELVIVRRKKKLLPECCPKKSKRQLKPVLKLYSSDDDEDTVTEYSHKVVRTSRKRHSKSDLEALHDIENPKPSTSAALVSEMARLKKLMKKELSGRSLSRRSTPTRFSTRRVAGNPESTPVVVRLSDRQGKRKIISTEPKMPVRAKTRKLDNEKALLTRRLSSQLDNGAKPKSISRKRKAAHSRVAPERQYSEPLLNMESKSNGIVVIKSSKIAQKRKRLETLTSSNTGFNAEVILDFVESNKAITPSPGNENLNTVPGVSQPAQILVGPLSKGVKVSSKIIARNSTEVNKNDNNELPEKLQLVLRLTPFDANRNNNEGNGSDVNDDIPPVVPIAGRNRRNLSKVEYNEKKLQINKKNTEKLKNKSPVTIIKPAKRKSTKDMVTGGILSLSRIKSCMSPIVVLTQSDRIEQRQEEETVITKVQESPVTGTEHFVRRSVRKRKPLVFPDL